MHNLQHSDLGYFLTNAFGNKYLYEINRNIFNKLGAETLYDSRYDKDFFKKNSLFIIIGTDSGLFPNYINKRGVPEGSCFLFIELPRVIDRLTEVVQAEKINPKIDIIPVDDLEARATALNFKDYIYLDNVFLVETFCAQDAYLDEYRRLFSIVRQQLEKNSWEIKAALGSKSFLLRQLENLPENQVSGTCLKNIFKDKTAVLLGGGPSLDEIIPWVKKHRENLVVLAVSRISSRLLEVDLIPDMIISVDPLLVNFDVSREMLHFRKALLVHSFHLCPPLLGQWPGKNVYVGPRLPWKTRSDESETLCVGPTVTHTALEVAIDLGFSKIILGGVDLCNSREGYSHAKGSQEHKNGPILGDMIASVETNGGWLAGTTAAYNMGIIVISDQAAKASKNGCRIINPAAGSAKISNVEYIALKNIEIDTLDEPPDQTILQVMPEQNSKSFVKHYQDMCKELQQARRTLKEIKKLCIEALAANDGLFGRRGKRADFKYKKQMDKIEKKLNNKYVNFTQVVKKLGAEEFLKMIRPSQEEWTDEEIENAGRFYYETYRDSAQVFINLIGQAEDRLRARLEEEKDKPNFEMLFNQWRSDKQPGRATIWQARNVAQMKDLDPDIQSTFIEMTTELKRHLDGETSLTKKYYFTGNPFNPSKVRIKSSQLLKQQDKEGLQKLLKGMSKHNHQHIAPLSHLIKGYIAELDDNLATAYDEYEKLFSSDTSPILEDGLKRIASLSLKLEDYSNALTAIECLTGISPIYMPNLADLLWMTGDNRRALDIYADYFTKIPDDMVSMLKLGNYYKKLNMEDGVRMAANYVLEKNPDNKAAQLLLDGIKG